MAGPINQNCSLPSFSFNWRPVIFGHQIIDGGKEREDIPAEERVMEMTDDVVSVIQ